MEFEHKLLKSNSHYSTFDHALNSLRQKGMYSDVTLVCNGEFYPVHKLVLAIYSEYLSEILEKTEGKNPLIILTCIPCSDLEYLLNYMYIGEVNVRMDEISSLMKAAELLKIKDIIQNEEPQISSYSCMSEKQNPPEEPQSFNDCRMTETQNPPVSMTIENTYTDVNIRGSCPQEKQNSMISIKQEQNDEEIQSSPLKRKRTNNDTPANYSPIVTSNSNPAVDGQNQLSAMVTIYPDDKLTIIQGKSKTNWAFYRGYRYYSDYTHKSGQQAWRCNKRGCRGRIHTLEDNRVFVRQVHDHEPDPRLLTKFLL